MSETYNLDTDRIKAELLAEEYRTEAGKFYSTDNVAELEQSVKMRTLHERIRQLGYIVIQKRIGIDILTLNCSVEIEMCRIN